LDAVDCIDHELDHETKQKTKSQKEFKIKKANSWTMDSFIITLLVDCNGWSLCHVEEEKKKTERI